jgi:hypothetical protein
MGDTQMKITKQFLKELISETIRGNSMILSEAEVSLSLDQVSAMLSDKAPKAKLQRIGIMTAENPRGVESNPQSNMAAMESFRQALDQKDLDYVLMGGKYGSPENSVLIINPTKLDIIAFGKQYKQAAVIFGQRLLRNYRQDQESNYFRIDYYQTEPDGTEEPDYGPQEYYLVDSRDMVVSDDTRQDYYSEIGGKKFYIPFFSNSEEHQLGDEPGAVAADPESEKQSYMR